MTPKSSARKRSRPSNGPSFNSDYPTHRSFHAAQRIHQACGMWPVELCKGFVPETWGIRLIEGLSALVSLAVSAETVTLEQVRNRLKVFALARSDRPRLRKSDIAKVRKWLRGLGVDTKQTKRWGGRQVDEDEEIDDSEDDSEPADEIIALGPREEMSDEEEDDEETEDDPDRIDEEEESAPRVQSGRSLSSETEEMFIPQDEPMGDTMDVDSRPEPAKTNEQPRGQSATYSSGSAAESSTRPRRNFQPPSRLVHDTPQSSVQRTEGSGERATASSGASTPQSSQSAHSTQRTGSQLLKKTVTSAVGSPHAPAPKSTMRPPQQKASQTPATVTQSSSQPRTQPPASVPSIPTPQSARQTQAGQPSNSQPSVPIKTPQNSSTPRAQPSSQPALSRHTSSTSQSSQQQLEHRPPAPMNVASQPPLYSHLAGSQPSISRPASAPGANKRPAPSSPANASTPAYNFNSKTAASISESLTGTSVKRQKTTEKPADAQYQRLEATGTLNWKALLPSGDEFRASLDVALDALQPHIQSFERLLMAIDDEHRRLTSVQRTLNIKREELAKDQRKAHEALKDVEKSTATEAKMLKDLQDLYDKHPGDSDLRMFLDKRKQTVHEHQEVYSIVESQLDRSIAGLHKTDRELAVVSKRVGQLNAERADVMREKTGIDTAAKRLMFMSRFMEPGWQTRLDMVEEALGEEVMRSAF